MGIALHVGQHDGDFVDAFNGIAVNGDASYIDYSVSFLVDNFTMTISDTDLPSSVTAQDRLERDGCRERELTLFS